MRKINITPLFLAIFTFCFSVICCYSDACSIHAKASLLTFADELWKKTNQTVSDFNEHLYDNDTVQSVWHYLYPITNITDTLYDISDNLLVYDGNQGKWVNRKYRTTTPTTVTWTEPVTIDPDRNTYLVRDRHTYNTGIDETQVVYKDTPIVTYDTTDDTIDMYNPTNTLTPVYDSDDVYVMPSTDDNNYVTLCTEDVTNYYIYNMTQYGCSISYLPKTSVGQATQTWHSYCIYYMVPNCSGADSSVFTREQLDNVIWTGEVYNSTVDIPENIMAYWSFDGSDDAITFGRHYLTSGGYVDVKTQFNNCSNNYTDGYFGNALQLNGLKPLTITSDGYSYNADGTLVATYDKSFLFLTSTIGNTGCAYLPISGENGGIKDYYTLEGWINVQNPVSGGSVANGWHHYAKVFYGGECVRTYVDGQLTTTGTMSSPRIGGASVITLDSYSKSFSFQFEDMTSTGIGYYISNISSASIPERNQINYELITSKYQYPNPAYITVQSKTLYREGDNKLYVYQPNIPVSIQLNTREQVEHYYPCVRPFFKDCIYFGFSGSSTAYNDIYCASQDDYTLYGGYVKNNDSFPVVTEYQNNPVVSNAIEQNQGTYYSPIPDQKYADLSNYLMDEVILTYGEKYTDNFTPVQSPLTTHKVVPSTAKYGSLCVTNDFGWNGDTVLVGGALPFVGEEGTVYVALTNDGFGYTSAIYNNGWKSTGLLVYDGSNWVDSSSFNFKTLTFKTTSVDIPEGTTINNYITNNILNEYDIDIDNVYQNIYNSYETTKDFTDGLPSLFSSITTLFTSIGVFPSVVTGLFVVLFAVLIVVLAIKVIKIILI